MSAGTPPAIISGRPLLPCMLIHYLVHWLLLATGGAGVVALDAAFPFDREAKLRARHSQQVRVAAVLPLLVLAVSAAP